VGGSDPSDEAAAARVAKWLIAFGAFALAAGGAILVLRNVPGLEELPLDIVFLRGGFSFFLPFGACIIASVIATGILWFIRRRKS
jgi:hypothetical protein